MKNIFVLFLSLTVLAPSFAPSLAFAEQGTQNFFPGLKKADLKIMGETSKKLDKNAAGSTAKWESEKTGNSGSMTLLSSEQLDGMACKELAHQFSIKGEGQAREFKGWVCQAKKKTKWLTAKEVEALRHKAHS